MKHMGRYALIAVTLLLITSVVLNSALFNRARQSYLDLNAVRLDPLDLDAFPNSVNVPSGRSRVVFFGDSRMARWPIPATFDRFDVVNRCGEAETSAYAALNRELESIMRKSD